MEVRSALEQDPADRIKIMETVEIDGHTYDYGSVSSICYWLENLYPEQTTRIAKNSEVRQMLLDKDVIVSIGAYPPMHSWARFAPGKGFQAFYEALQDAEADLRRREPLKSDENPLTGWLAGGLVWGIRGAEEVTASEREPNDLAVVFDEASGRTWINLGEDEPYSIEVLPDQAEEIGKHLYDLVSAIVGGTATGESAAFETELETIYLTADMEKGVVDLFGNDWGGEDSGVMMTPAQADEISWQLREFAAVARRIHKATFQC